MLKIRLSRVGRKHITIYRVVLTEHRESAKHGYIAVLGSYDPHTKKLEMDHARAETYIQNGAQYSDRMVKILSQAKAK
jgi:small subunit ribosomal protein S16